jgi:hypothetical protein
LWCQRLRSSFCSQEQCPSGKEMFRESTWGNILAIYFWSTAFV